MPHTLYPFDPSACASYLEKAEQLRPALLERTVRPFRTVEGIADPAAYQGYTVRDVEPCADTLSRAYGNGDAFTLDFGDHCVGYLHLHILPGSERVPDSPLRLRLTFAELPQELMLAPEDYRGALSSTWLQHEILNVDFIPGELRLPRRYAFRYLKIEILGRGTAYTVRFADVFCTAVSSADRDKLPPLPDGLPADIAAIDRVACRTLEDCMQSVFEDGPKRDRRLWIGDLRLQALANYATFHNIDLVRRCLYLFAGALRSDNWVSCAVFTDPVIRNDAWHLLDYSLFFISILHDDYAETGDLDFVRELWPVAFLQVELASGNMDERGMAIQHNTFVDWCPDLDKQCSTQAIVIYTFRQALTLAEALNDTPAVDFLRAKLAQYVEAARSLFDPDEQLFVSGPARQISWASQVWMVLARVCDDSFNRALLRRLDERNPPVTMHTPYMYHHYIDALLSCGEKEKALSAMRAYWGDMVQKGADTFFEAFNPDDDLESPYGDSVINSYCHAWSCTPTYLIRRRF